ncbi:MULTISPECIES: nucleotidyltransferase family protein [unclassified Polynucleobacter]|uniref:nucleotidyltransferase family protein n=1 Tax=unclassified Polynucleobacter TaxID=2640945 RepID=UPI0008BA9053|nr:MULTISPECIES: nucleotidyltransferase family protein [unclassified Polynucleobacter]OHC09852.1 MAG: mannose-1-phosphate guanylyltransferase [Polynucleobacter sp. GWA2_45_21]HBK42815.1 mannose-1-phosphate guanylyltransferase [Polynucleobacter sp.]
MNALLLAGGFGSRLKPITNTIPKCMVPINGRPLIDYWLEILFEYPENPINRALINTHYLPEIVTTYIQNCKWRSLISISYEERLLGTAGTISKNRDFFEGKSFLVAHADNLSKFNLDSFIHAHAARMPKVEITAMSFITDAPHSCGILEIDENNLITSYTEKPEHPSSNLANGAVYIFEPSVIAFIDSFQKHEVDIGRDILPHYAGKMQAYHNSIYHRDIGTPESLRLARRDFNSNL